MLCLFISLNNYFDIQAADLPHAEHVLCTMDLPKQIRQAKFPSKKELIVSEPSYTYKRIRARDAGNLVLVFAISLFSCELLGGLYNPCAHTHTHGHLRIDRNTLMPSSLQRMCPFGCEIIIRKGRSLQNSQFLAKEITYGLNLGWWDDKTMIYINISVVT